MSVNQPNPNQNEPFSQKQFLNEEYTINTPENVTFVYDVAGIGSRFIGALVDSVILAVALFLLNMVLMLAISLFAPQGFELFEAIDNEQSDEMWFVGLAIAIYALLNFIVLWGYYIFFEMLWRGQTPGKRAANIRVVRMDGNAIGFLESVIRNLVRIIDFMPTGYGIGLIVMFFNRQSRRLGDFAAGTLVIHEQKAQTLNDFVGPSQGSDSLSQIQSGQPQPSLSQPNQFRQEQSGQFAPQPGLQASESSTAYGGAAHGKPTGSTSGLPPAAPATGLTPAPATGLTAAPATGLSAAMSAPSAAVDPLRERFINIQQLGSLDFELVVDTLNRNQTTPIPHSTISRMARVMATKLQMEPPTSGHHQYLTDLAEAYRRYHR